MNVLRLGSLTAVASLLFVSAAGAQVLTPTYQTPRGANDVGVYASDGPGDLAVEGIFRRNFGASDLGLRLGVVDTDNSGALFTVGGELRNRIPVTAPLDLALTLGAQGIFGDVTAAGFQGGLSIGHTFVSPGFNVTPYFHPRLAGVNTFGDHSDFELEVLPEVGVELSLSPRLSLRFAGEFGDVGADWGLGLSWR